MPPVYLGDALNILFGAKESEEKAEFKRTTDSLKALGWEFEKFDEKEGAVCFRKGKWGVRLKA